VLVSFHSLLFVKRLSRESKSAGGALFGWVMNKEVTFGLRAGDTAVGGRPIGFAQPLHHLELQRAGRSEVY